MKNQKKLIKKAINIVVGSSLRNDANRTSCMAIYQPKAPANLKKYSKMENDK